MGASWTHLLVRPLARPLIWLGVTPNQITALHLIVGIATVAAIAWGAPGADIVAGFAWLFACLLDRVDGEVARIGDMCTEAGHKFDTLVDMAVGSAYFLGLGLGLRGLPHPWSVVAVACGVLACLNHATLNKVAETFDNRSDDGKILASRWGFDADDALYLLGPLLWLPASLRFGAVILAALGTTGFLLLFVHRLAGQKRRQAGKAFPRPAE